MQIMRGVGWGATFPDQSFPQNSKDFDIQIQQNPAHRILFIVPQF